MGEENTSVFLCVTVILLDLQPSTRKTNSAPTCINQNMYHYKIIYTDMYIWVGQTMHNTSPTNSWKWTNFDK